MTGFKRLEIARWQQFAEIAIDFDRQVTILTGANGSGKTTLLQLLARHSGWTFSSLSVPLNVKLGQVFRWMGRVFRNAEVTGDQIGNLVYGDGKTTALSVPQVNSAAYQLSFSNQQPIACIFVPSHRSN